MSGSILIVARNNLRLTKLAVRSALAQDVTCGLIVIDNASSDGTAQWLRTKSFVTASMTRQISLSECWNRGIRAFWSAGANEALVCNNDIELRSDTYRMLDGINAPFVTGVGVDKREQVGTPGDRTLTDLWKTQRPHPTFAAFLIRKEVTDKIGFFDEAYFPAYCEDQDYHLRMHHAGIKAVCVDLPFLHYGSATAKNASKVEQAIINKGAEESRHRFYMKWKVKPGSKEYEDLFK